jgi:hypothetical protein
MAYMNHPPPPTEPDYIKNHQHMQEAADAYISWVQKGAEPQQKAGMAQRFPEMTTIADTRELLAHSLARDERLQYELSRYDSTIVSLIRRSESLGAVVQAVETAFEDLYKLHEEQQKQQKMREEGDAALDRFMERKDSLSAALRDIPQPEPSPDSAKMIFDRVQADLAAEKRQTTSTPGEQGTSQAGLSEAGVRNAVTHYIQAEQKLATESLDDQTRAQLSLSALKLKQALGERFEPEYEHQLALQQAPQLDR